MKGILLIGLLFMLNLKVMALKGSLKSKLLAFKPVKSLVIFPFICLNSFHLSNNPALGFGPINMDLQITDYHQVDLCNGKKPVLPGQKAVEGLFPVCIEVEADIINPEKSKSLTDVSVYGYVKEDAAGNSVLANNPDFRSDAGQYAMIDKVAPGRSHIKYQFVAAVSNDPKEKPIPKLTFFNSKAVSFPGGAKFRPLDICEMDPFACNNDEDE